MARSIKKKPLAGRIPIKFFFFGILLVLVTGCSYPISEAVRQEAAGNIAFGDVLARPSAYQGTVVVWGGIVMKVVNLSGRSELYLREVPLDSREKPADKEFSNGLFVAGTSEFLDPQKYSAGRKVTVAGKISGGEMGTYNDRPYLYPLVEIKEIHLWRETIKWNWGRTPYYWPNQYSPAQQYRQRID